MVTREDTSRLKARNSAVWERCALALAAMCRQGSHRQKEAEGILHELADCIMRFDSRCFL